MENLVNSTGRPEPLPLDGMVAVQLLDLFRDPDHDVDRIVDFISNDPLLSAETLRRCNNAAFRGAERTTDIFEAVSRLGFYELYGIISATIGAHGMLRRTSSAPEPDLWTHANPVSPPPPEAGTTSPSPWGKEPE